MQSVQNIVRVDFIHTPPLIWWVSRVHPVYVFVRLCVCARLLGHLFGQNIQNQHFDVFQVSLVISVSLKYFSVLKAKAITLWSRSQQKYLNLEHYGQCLILDVASVRKEKSHMPLKVKATTLIFV